MGHNFFCWVCYFPRQEWCKHINSSPYHPSTNGLAEHFVHTLKQAMKRSNFPGPHQKLMNFLLSYRSTPHSTTNTTSSELFLHRSLRTRLHFLRPELGVVVLEKQGEQKKYYDLHSRNRNFFIEERVLVRNMRNNPRWLLGTIVEQRGPWYAEWICLLCHQLLWTSQTLHMDKLTISWETLHTYTKKPYKKCTTPIQNQ